MSVATAKVRLMAATRDLRISWSIATQQWNDPASRAFEKNHVALFEKQVRSAITALDTMHETMQTMYRECGDD
jgi:hypothetical protein